MGKEYSGKQGEMALAKWSLQSNRESQKTTVNKSKAWLLTFPKKKKKGDVIKLKLIWTGKIPSKGEGEQGLLWDFKWADGEKEPGYSKCQVTASENEFGVFENERGAGSQAWGKE